MYYWSYLRDRVASRQSERVSDEEKERNREEILRKFSAELRLISFVPSDVSSR